MISKNLTEAFPFISNYFKELIESSSDRFPQSIVFEGIDPYAQCFFALELARILNCTEDAKGDCQCLNCKWIRQGSHPAINFVSQLHFKSDDSHSVISATQAKEIEKNIRETSDYHRFFIFFDAKSRALNKLQSDSLEKFSPQGYDICPEGNWSLDHINSKTFNAATPNILLKSVEEPPRRTTFVFLTKNKADLINTIVSRSQVFKLSCTNLKSDVSYVKEIFTHYPNLSYDNAFKISDSLQNHIKDNDIPISYVLDGILEFLTDCIKNSGNGASLQKIREDIKHLSEAKKWAISSMSDKVIFDTLMLKIARNNQ